MAHSCCESPWATQWSWPTRKLTNRDPTWYSSYGTPSTPGADPPPRRTAASTAARESGASAKAGTALS
eukprot:3735571-Alexandrium_andersonii.AAC.1